MSSSFAFRTSLARRLAKAAGIALVTLPASRLLGCGGKVAFDAGAQSGAGSGAGGASNAASTAAGVGGACFTAATVASGPQGPSLVKGTKCFEQAPSQPCPSPANAATLLTPDACHVIASVDDRCGSVMPGQCCYDVTEELTCEGRPFLIDGVPITAKLIVAAPTAPFNGVDRDGPHGSALSPELRAKLALAYADDALAEHASVASFARFALELMAVGAPADLVLGAHRAAIDEVEHAEACFELARVYDGRARSAGPLPLGADLHVCTHLTGFAAETAREGCVRETLNAMVAATRLEGATDPVVKRVLAKIVADEARHAELSWRALAWALRTGGAAAHCAVSAILKELTHHAPSVATPSLGRVERGALAAHGQIDDEARREALLTGLKEVVRPCLAALLEATAPNG